MVRLSEAQRSRTSLGAAGVVAAMVIVADLATKWSVTRWLGASAGGREWWIVDGHLGLEYGRNSGAAFGLFAGNAELLAAASILVAVGCCWLILQEVDGLAAKALGAGLLLGGAIGNLVERVRQAYVTDFIAVGPWPRFNIADSAITVAALIFIFAVVFQPRADVGDERQEEEH